MMMFHSLPAIDPWDENSVCSNLNQSGSFSENVNADWPNKEDDLVDRAVDILDKVVAARDKHWARRKSTYYCASAWLY